MIGLRTLVLNADYQPKNLLKLEAIPVEHALSDFFSQNCVVVDTYDRVVKTMKVKNRVAIPSVIAYKKMHRRPETLALHKKNLLLRDGYKCVYCGIPLNEDVITFDHYVPASLGGATEWNNILSSCKKCNHAYGRTPAEKKKPKHKPYYPSYHKLAHMRRYHKVTVDHESWVKWLGLWYADVFIKGRKLPFT